MVEKYGIPESEISLASASGLGVNRVTPRAMMQAYRALRFELAQKRYTMADIMPVAGIDPGTLEKRFTSSAARGSVIAKTGTLGNTDGGVSSLVGEMKTAKNEIFIFVIFNQRGSVSRFRTFQEDFVAYIQNERGGPAPFIYVPQPWATRLSDTKTTITNKLYQPPTD
jgi:D-alanyl-D-alanine carboxypeptidase/D-alanyl-D-alanine-endopeptidase (penicillin-binding protein 4)